MLYFDFPLAGRGVVAALSFGLAMAAAVVMLHNVHNGMRAMAV